MTKTSIQAWFFKHRHFFQRLAIIFMALIFILELWLFVSLARTKWLMGQLDLDYWPFKLVGTVIVGLLAHLPKLGLDYQISIKENPYDPIRGYTISSLSSNLSSWLLPMRRVRRLFYGEEEASTREKSKEKDQLLTLALGLVGVLGLLFGRHTVYMLWYLLGSLIFGLGMLAWYWYYNRQVPKLIDLVLALSDLLLPAALFALIGWLFGVGVAFDKAILLMFAAQIVGSLSGLPGRWGALDLILMIYLCLQLDYAIALAWVLMFRIVYNLVPALASGLALIKHLLFRWDGRYRGLPSQLSTQVLHYLNSRLIYVLGILLVLISAVPDAIEEMTLLKHYFSDQLMTYHLVQRTPGIALGFLLILSGRVLINRVTRGYLPSMILLVLASIYVFSYYQMWWLSAGFILAMILTLLTQKMGFKRQFIYAWEQVGFDIGAGILVIVTFFGIRLMTGKPIHNRHWQVHEIGLVALVMVGMTVVLWLYHTYLKGPSMTLGESLDPERAQRILGTYGDSHYANLIWLGDKRLFYYQGLTDQDTSFIQFRIKQDKAIVMSDPVGRVEDQAVIVERFINQAEQLGYRPVFYEVSEKIAMILHEFGYDFLKLGEEALVDVNTFNLSGKKKQNLRSVYNQADKAGFVFEVLNPPYSQLLFKQLQAISEEWLNGRKEAGFSLGFYDEAYINHDQLAILRNKTGQVVAFASLVTSHSERSLSVDLMRFTKEAPNGIMDVLFIHLYDYAKTQDKLIFNMGMSPLANVGQKRQSFVRERLANLVYHFGTSIYSFEGLRRYKQKFADKWVPMYIAYSRKSNLLFVLLALLLVDNKGDEL